MPTWQFWTLVSVAGIYVISTLSALLSAVNRTNEWLVKIYERLSNQD